jgi:hypothetical protein
VRVAVVLFLGAGVLGVLGCSGETEGDGTDAAAADAGPGFDATQDQAAVSCLVCGDAT